MNKSRRRRLSFILFILTSLFLAVGIAVYALKQTIDLFYSPSDIVAGKVQSTREFRLGGMVKAGSVIHKKSDPLAIEFTVTDNAHQVEVFYRGILPDLFRDGQGVVAQGALDSQGQFHATEILAKHDATYMPKPVQEIMRKNT